MKVIFLDIDGVLCTRRAWSNREQDCVGGKLQPGEFHKPVIQMFEKWLAEHPEVDIVLSSTWRRGKADTKFPQFFWKNRIGKESELLVSRIIGVTPVHADSFRGREIDEWLDTNGQEVTHFAIIDDDDYDQTAFDHFVQTKTQIGLTHAHLREVERILEL